MTPHPSTSNHRSSYHTSNSHEGPVNGNVVGTHRVRAWENNALTSYACMCDETNTHMHASSTCLFKCLLHIMLDKRHLGADVSTESLDDLARRRNSTSAIDELGA